MSDEPGHKAMLYFLEVLMNSTGPLTISQLAGRFGSSNFTSEMRTAAGGNESGLKQFLLKYPSLFTIRGNMVALYDGKEEEEVGGQDSSTSSGASRRSLPDVSVEMDAVQFFQHQLGKREEKWVPVKSLAGHLSQTTQEVRNIVGPQLEFKKWLLRHMHIFEVQGEVVALREGLAPPPTPSTQRRITFDLPNNDAAPTSIIVPPKTPPPQRRGGLPLKNASSLHRSHSFGDRSQLNSYQGHLAPLQSALALRRHNSPVTMTANEYKAVMYVKDVLEKKGAMKLHALLNCLGQASENIRSTVGTLKSDLEEFLKRNSGLFAIVNEDTVDLIKNAKLSVIITGSKPPTSSSSRITNTGKGKIFHVAKLWGIIDLGEHEHVFFDRSIMLKPMDDLQKHFQVDEMLCFNAVLAHKTSRAKWKATHVWKENEQEPSSLSVEEVEPSDATRQLSLSHSLSIEDEINEFLPKPDRDGTSDQVALFSDAELSGAGVIPIWNFKQDEERNKRASVSIVPESYQMSASALSDLRFVPDFGASLFYGSASIGVDGLQNGQSGKSDPRSMPGNATKPKKFASVACQTVSTSDIIATQLYQDA